MSIRRLEDQQASPVLLDMLYMAPVNFFLTCFPIAACYSVAVMTPQMAAVIWPYVV